MTDKQQEAERLLANRRGYAGVALRDLDMEAAVESLLAEVQRVAQERDEAVAQIGVNREAHRFDKAFNEAGVRAQLEAAEQRAARLEAALRATGTPLPDGTHCWCPVVAEMADSHDEYCQEARALIGDAALAPAPEAQP